MGHGHTEGDKLLLEAFSLPSLYVHFLNELNRSPEALSLFIDEETEVQTILVITECPTANRWLRENPAQSSDPIPTPLYYPPASGGRKGIR